jgi:hypothetical protein
MRVRTERERGWNYGGAVRNELSLNSPHTSAAPLIECHSGPYFLLLCRIWARLCCTSATSKAFPDINFNPSQPPNKPARAINRRRGESQAARRRLLIKFTTRQSWFCARNLRRGKILLIVVRGLIYLSRLCGTWCAAQCVLLEFGERSLCALKLRPHPD